MVLSEYTHFFELLTQIVRCPDDTDSHYSLPGIGLYLSFFVFRKKRWPTKKLMRVASEGFFGTPQPWVGLISPISTPSRTRPILPLLLNLRTGSFFVGPKRGKFSLSGLQRVRGGSASLPLFCSTTRGGSPHEADSLLSFVVFLDIHGLSLGTIRSLGTSLSDPRPALLKQLFPRLP